MSKIRTGQVSAPLTRAQFHERFMVRFYDPAFEGEHEAIARLEEIAWDALQEGRNKAVKEIWLINGKTLVKIDRNTAKNWAALLKALQ